MIEDYEQLPMDTKLARAWLVLLLAVWAGLVVGVSFLATPAKFNAPSLSIAVALDVGRHTFRVLAWAELVMAAGVSLLCWATKPSLSVVATVGVLWSVILVNRLWLLPTLDQRVSLYISGITPDVTYHHALFIGLEALKVILLISCALKASQRI